MHTRKANKITKLKHFISPKTGTKSLQENTWVQ